MDSFYDEPRRAPRPNTLSAIPEKLSTNLMPDASMLMQNKGNIIPKKSEMSYNAWKYQFRNATNKENNLPASQAPMGSILRKHVRFQTPQPVHVANVRAPSTNLQPIRPALVNRPSNPIFTTPLAKVTPTRLEENDPSAMPRLESRKILQEKPFEKMYMANIPNRNLDLSVIEPPRNTFQRSNSAPANYYNTNNVQQGFSSANARQADSTVGNAIRPPVAESTALELRKPEPQTNNDEPTVKDLLKIIQQQNEQLIQLQQQVSTLLRERSEQPQITAPPRLNDLCASPVFKHKALDLANKQKLPNKFAIDVMTSFEVSIRGPKRFSNKLFNTDNDQAKITEISEATSSNVLNDSAKQSNDLSLKFDEPVVVTERCPSPENSIHVDMKDFSSDDDDETDSTIGDVNNSMIGWTIYNNVMDQVNYMLKKSVDTKNNIENGNDKTDMQGQCTGAILKQVKEATLKHLKKVGVDLKYDEDNETISSDAAYTSNQISFAVKQLLMKYLPEEQLANIVKHPDSWQKAPILSNAPYPKNLIKRRPDFSLATVQYMEKYNLLNNAGLQPQRKPTGSDKMLDITALKQQPKLI